MSLVNNSANNFKDFLDAIKPYLNYQFYDLSGQGVEANNFSTDEKIIGTWIDGKPLYQKTVNFGALPNNDEKSVLHNISGIDNIVDVFGIGKSSSDWMPIIYPGVSTVSFGISMYVDNTKIYITTGANRSGYSAYVTLRYTKTTDTVVASGEKIVGQWIDGKPVYEKTINIPGNDKYNVGSSWIDTGVSSMSNIDTIIDTIAISYDDLYYPTVISMSDTYIKIMHFRDNVNIGFKKITIRYTKTTD